MGVDCGADLEILSLHDLPAALPELWQQSGLQHRAVSPTATRAQPARSGAVRDLDNQWLQ